MTTLLSNQELLDATEYVMKLEDHGQDFLYWFVDLDDNVIECLPFQRDHWIGTFVYEAKAGKRPHISTKYSGMTTLNYPVERVIKSKRTMERSLK